MFSSVTRTSENGIAVAGSLNLGVDSQIDDFRARYTVARQIQADVWRDEIYDLAKSLPPVDPKTGRIDHGAVAHIRNQVGTLRWLAVKLLPTDVAGGKSRSDAVKRLG